MSNNNKSAIISVILLLFTFLIMPEVTVTNAQNSNEHAVEWEQYYTQGYPIDGVQFIVQDRDGGYVFAAPNNHYSFLSLPPEILLVKTDNSGNLQWQYQFNGSNSGGAGSASVAGLCQTGDGGVVFAGSLTFSGVVDTVMVKVDSNGRLIWNQTYPYASYESSMVQTSDGGFALVGLEGAYIGTPAKIWFLKTDSVGNIEWNTTVEGGLVDREGGLSHLIQTADGNYAISGYAYTENSTITSNTNANLVLMKINAAGILIWNRTYDLGIYNWGEKALVQTDDEGYILTDYTGTAVVIKTDGFGSVQWTKSYNISTTEGTHVSTAGTLNSAIVTSDGGFAFAGTSSFGEIWVIKTDSSGNIQWNQTYGDKDQYGYGGYSILESSDGGLLVGGYWQQMSHADQYYLAKINAGLPMPTPAPSPPPTTVPSPSAVTENSLLLPALIAAVAIAVVACLIVVIRKKR